ncbi:MAG: iron ABC transporter permease, partial [Ramlibacter sp.]|nr:iron ABC transporter permease [Ramlibacter sp.]
MTVSDFSAAPGWARWSMGRWLLAGLVLLALCLLSLTIG